MPPVEAPMAMIMEFSFAGLIGLSLGTMGERGSFFTEDGPATRTLEREAMMILDARLSTNS